MNAATLLLLNSPLWSPALFALLVMLSVVLGWQALAPNQPKEAVQTRLNSYLQRGHSVEDAELTKPFGSRVLAPAFRRLLGLIGAIAPKRNAEMTRQMLLNAGEPGHLTVLDFLGLRILGAILLGCIGLYLTRGQALLRILLFAGSAGLLGYLAPIYWLRAKANGRKRAIQRALPDALDMLTIGVEAGLAFDSAMIRVGERWNNALTREFRRAVAEMRVGSTREAALERMAERCGVPDLTSFVAVLLQSSQLGVSVANVLHTQAAEMRRRRRERSEELARQASVKMLFPLVFCIFPAIMVVILGPAIPSLISTFHSMASGQ